MPGTCRSEDNFQVAGGNVPRGGSRPQRRSRDDPPRGPLDSSRTPKAPLKKGAGTSAFWSSFDCRGGRSETSQGSANPKRLESREPGRHQKAYVAGRRSETSQGSVNPKRLDSRDPGRRRKAFVAGPLSGGRAGPRGNERSCGGGRGEIEITCVFGPSIARGGAKGWESTATPVSRRPPTGSARFLAYP